MKHKLWMHIHTYLSLFFLPVMLIYAITGVLYIFEIRQNSGASIIEIPLDSMPKKGEEQTFMLDVLQKHNLKTPSDTQVRQTRGGLSMGNVKYGVSIAKDKNDRPILRAIERNLYGVLMLMHKSTGTKYEIGGFRFSLFDFVAMGFGTSLLIFYFSGLVVTTFCKHNRKAALAVCGLGFVTTILAVYFSV